MADDQLTHRSEYWMSVCEVAQALGVDESAVVASLEQGKLRGSQSWWVEAQDLEDYKREQA